MTRVAQESVWLMSTSVKKKSVPSKAAFDSYTLFIIKVWVDAADNNIILNTSQRTCHDYSSSNITLPFIEGNLYIQRKTLVFP